ncbi:MAG: hypothetical protein JWN44_3498 [Myxococcales bacterium]|nr:hypothetical protein [Myxococcales bacterium]
MLALITPKIVSDLRALAESWTAVAEEMNAEASAIHPTVGRRKRNAKTKKRAAR